MEPRPKNEVDRTGDPTSVAMIHRHLAGDLTPAEFEQIERDMLASPELRQAYLRAIRIDATLRDHALHVSEPTVSPRERTWWRTAAIAATVALCGLALWKVNPRDNAAGTVTTARPVEIATLADSRDCVWAGSAEFAINKRLSAGMLELESGVALIEFDEGARLALQGPAALELIGTKTARLHHGSASVRCEDGLYSFSLLTPNSIVTDLGTEFGAAVAKDGTSELHVLEGEIEVTGGLNDARQHNRFLTTGNTLLVSANGANEELPETNHRWIRDYTTQSDREAKAAEPRVIAHDWFPTDTTRSDRFSLGSGWRDSWWESTPPRKGALFGFAPANPLVARHGETRSALVVGGWVEARRFLAEPIDPTQARTVYLGFSIYRTNPTKRDATGKLSEATVMFRSSADPASVLGVALSGRNYLVVLERGGWERSEVPVNALRPLFIVARVEFNPLRGNRVAMAAFDQASPIPVQEPAQWDLVTRRQLARLSEPIDTISLQVRQAPFKFGEITLGNSWESVTRTLESE
jgi:ferric-dicitrate binding protein FerR (iron transport regulator)